MPKFLEDILKKEYPNNPHAVFGTMNKIGAMHGNQITPQGEAMERKHEADMAQPTARVRSAAGKPQAARRMHGDGSGNHWSGR